MQSCAVNVGGSAQRCRISRNGAQMARRRCAGVGSRGCQSPGWRARVCGRGTGEMCARARHVPPRKRHNDVFSSQH